MSTIESPRIKASRTDAAVGGGVVAQPGPDGHIRVAVVHRQLNDDWSFPKARCRRGEATVTAALRAVRDEAGFQCVAEMPLGARDYLGPRGRLTAVAYWGMTRVLGGFAVTAEVDALQWLRPPEAFLRLTSERERSLLAAAVPVLTDTVQMREGFLASSRG